MLFVCGEEGEQTPILRLGVLLVFCASFCTVVKFNILRILEEEEGREDIAASLEYYIAIFRQRD